MFYYFSKRTDDEMHDLDVNKLSSLAAIQQKFPNDNLNLFENLNCKITALFDDQADDLSSSTAKLNANCDLDNFPLNQRRFTNISNSSSATAPPVIMKDISSNVSTSSSSSTNFVSKHLLNLQRRKTIHDIEVIQNYLQNHQQQQNIDEFMNEQLSSTSSSLTELPMRPSKPRELIKQGNATLIGQDGKRDRYFFLFNDLLIIAKQKNENYYKLKYRLHLTDIWLSDCFDAIYWQYNRTDTSFVIGWPTSSAFIVDFKDAIFKDIWLKKFKELISVEKQGFVPINIKISFNKDSLGSTEPTPMSQCYTKTVQIAINETSQDIVTRCKNLFNLKSSSQNDYQLCFKTGNNESLIPLIGHEYPYAIKIHFLREGGKTIKTDDNSLKFVLIDRSSIKSKDSDSDLDRLQKLRKRMFWSRQTNATLDISTQSSNVASSSIAAAAAATLSKPFSRLKHRSHLFGVKLEKLCSQSMQLPAALLNLLEKVAAEGPYALMIFRKSASAKLKKYYRQKIDSNQAIDYDEMNVHVAGLLLKEYLRDYPDGIIEYTLYPECLNVLKNSDLNAKLKSIKSILDKLPYWNHKCLCYFMCLFNYVSLNSNLNKMDAHNISVCVAPSLFHKLDKPNDVETSLQTISFVRLLIENIEVLFGKSTLNLLKATEVFNVPAFESKQQHQQQKQLNSIASSIITTATSTMNNYHLDTDSNDGHNINDDCSIDDVFCTSSEIESFETGSKMKTNSKTALLTKSLNGYTSATAGFLTMIQSNRNDLSSNTLSVDSGLSVPTATSDPESEKSSGLNEKTPVTPLVSQFQQKLRSFSVRDNLDLKTNDMLIDVKSKYCLNETDNEGDNDDDDDDVVVVVEAPVTGETTTTTTTTTVTSKLYKKVSNIVNNKKYMKKNSMTIMKQFSESDVFYDSISKDDTTVISKYYSHCRTGSVNNEYETTALKKCQKLTVNDGGKYSKETVETKTKSSSTSSYQSNTVKRALIKVNFENDVARALDGLGDDFQATIRRRKVSKTKDDYKPSRQFVENLQGARAMSRSSSIESSTSGSSCCSITSDDAFISVDDNSFKNSKRTRNKNSVSRAKSFNNYQQTSSPIESKLKLLYMNTTNETDDSKCRLRRCLSLRHYEDIEPTNSSQLTVTRTVNTPRQQRICSVATMNSTDRRTSLSAFSELKAKHEALSTPTFKPVPIQNPSKLSSILDSKVFNVNKQQQRTIDVTWSVSNIRKQFEASKQTPSTTTTTTTTITRKSIKSISSVFQDEPPAQLPKSPFKVSLPKARANSTSSTLEQQPGFSNPLKLIRS